MKHLMRHKFVFGLLMACVLAFGVQGGADAFTVKRSSTQNDFVGTSNTTFDFAVDFSQAEVDANTYTISLSVSPADGVGISSISATGTDSHSLTGNTITLDPSSVSVVVTVTYSISAQGKYAFSARGKAVFVHYQVSTSENRDVTSIDKPEILPILVTGGSGSSGPQSFNFTVESGQVGDQLQISAPTSSTWNFKNFTHPNFLNSSGEESSIIGSGAGQTAITLYAKSTSSGTITVNYELTAVGKHEVTVGANNEKFTAYGVRSAEDVTDFKFVDPTGTVNKKVELGDPNPTNNYFFDEVVTVTLGNGPLGSSNHSWTLVDFEIVDGSGVLYEDLDGDSQPDPGKSATQTVTTHTNASSVATVRLQTRDTTNVIEASIRNSNLSLTRNKHVVTYFYNYPQIVKISGDAQVGTPSTQLERPLVVEVRDAKGTAIPQQEIVFEGSQRSGENGNATFNLVTGYPDIDGTTSSPNQTARIVTDDNGRAQIYAVLPSSGTDEHIDVWIDNNNDDTFDSATEYRIANSFTATLQSATASLGSIARDSGDRQSAGRNQPVPNPLIVIVRDERGLIDHGVNVTFTTDSGVLSHPLSTDPGTAVTSGVTSSSRRRVVETDETGRASVRYNVGDVPGAKSVRASINTGPLLDQIRHVTFNINGTGSTNQTTTPNPYLSFSPSSLSGSPGQQRSFRVDAYDANGNLQNGISVSLSSGISGVPSSINSGETINITLPNNTGSISATAANYTSRSLSVSVQAVPDEVVKVSGDNQEGEPGDTLSSPFVVRVEDSSNIAIAGQTVTFRVTAGGGSLSPTSATTDSSGQASTTLTLGSSGGTNTVEASVSGVSSTVTFTAEADEGPSSLVIAYGNGQESLPNRRLGQPLGVQVLDSDGNGIRGVWVNFTLKSGSGRVVNSRGRARTDAEGIADGEFVPSAVGTAVVEASFGDLTPVTFTIYVGGGPEALVKVSGDRQTGRPGAKLANPFVVEVLDEDDEPLSDITVTFSVTEGGGSVSPTSARTNNKGRAQTKLTLGKAIGENTVTARVAGLTDRITFSARTGAQVLVKAGARPPMYWVDRTNGTLHRLVDAEVEALASNTKGATNIAVDAAGGYIYWAAQTGQNKGAIRRAGLNGRGVQTLKTVSALPMGIAVDSAGGMVYWTNNRGNILSIPVSGGKVTNVARNLSNPGPLALSNGVLYWGQATGSVHKMSLTAKPKKVQNLVTGLGEPLAIAIAKGKVYWIERGGGGSGKLQRANLNGKNIQQLKAFASGVPIGFAVDSSANRIYWTKAAGKIQRSNLAGRFVRDIVTGLPNPGSIALGVSGATTQTATPNQTTQQTQQTQQTTTDTAYDVNGDGAVNDADVNAVALAVALGSDDAAYDVNGDGSVDAKDLRAVMANTDDDAAAPVVAIEIDVTVLDVMRLHEQIALLLSTGDKSLATQRALAYLQQLLTLARPDETVLLANYPNPFNPETWIPYHLANSTDVTIRIYDAQGVLVRELTVGHQLAGYYTSRSRAAYWDGRNAFGERVASGIYFYQLETDEMSPLRKMVILK